jgi:hypothetical protein
VPRNKILEKEVKRKEVKQKEVKQKEVKQKQRRRSMPPNRYTHVQSQVGKSLSLYHSQSDKEKGERRQRYHLELQAFYQHHKPEKLKDLTTILDSWAGIEHLLMQELQIKQKYEVLLQAFLCAHDKKKLSQIDAIMAAHAGREEAMMRHFRGENFSSDFINWLYSFIKCISPAKHNKQNSSNTSARSLREFSHERFSALHRRMGPSHTGMEGPDADCRADGKQLAEELHTGHAMPPNAVATETKLRHISTLAAKLGWQDWMLETLAAPLDGPLHGRVVPKDARLAGIRHGSTSSNDLDSGPECWKGSEPEGEGGEEREAEERGGEEMVVQELIVQELIVQERVVEPENAIANTTELEHDEAYPELGASEFVSTSLMRALVQNKGHSQERLGLQLEEKVDCEIEELDDGIAVSDDGIAVLEDGIEVSDNGIAVLEDGIEVLDELKKANGADDPTQTVVLLSQQGSEGGPTSKETKLSQRASEQNLNENSDHRTKRRTVRSISKIRKRTPTSEVLKKENTITDICRSPINWERLMSAGESSDDDEGRGVKGREAEIKIEVLPPTKLCSQEDTNAMVVEWSEQMFCRPGVQKAKTLLARGEVTFVQFVRLVESDQRYASLC